jgi:NAD(P)-dependent dehydrogenase (short-subunit alcohol dehydrogenase family)
LTRKNKPIFRHRIWLIIHLKEKSPFFYPAESKDSTTYNQTAAALSKYAKTGLTDIQDIAPLIRFIVSEGWWITGQTIFANGGYTTR